MNYTLTPQRTEVLLRFTDTILLIELERGSVLARSLGARLSRGYVGYYLSPSAARKFTALFDAGFSAYRCFRSGEHVWRYGRDDAECKRLPDAVGEARSARSVEVAS